MLQESELFLSSRSLSSSSSNSSLELTFLRSSFRVLHTATTHLLLPTPAATPAATPAGEGKKGDGGRRPGLTRTEKLLSAIADGRVWILRDAWMVDSIRSERERERDKQN